MSGLIFYHNPMSRGRIAHWMLEETGAPYETRVLDFTKGEHKSAQYLELNPMGKIPTIVHNGVVVTECAAICAYLADAFPEHELAPAIGDPARGSYYRWLFFGAGCVEPAVLDKSFNRPPVERKGAVGYGSYEDTIATLEKAVEKGPWILGEKFSAADVYVGSQIGWGIFTKGIEPRPAFQQYLARIGERPAYKRATDRDNAAVAKAQAK
jgi:glutathione S-transferase